MKITIGWAAMIASMIGSAFCIAGYMANGIVHGSLVGLRGREQDLQTSSSRSLFFLLAALALQIATAVSVARLLPSRFEVANTPARIVAGLLLSVLGTILLFSILIKLNQTLRFM